MIYVGNILEFRYFGCTLSTFRTVGSGIYSTNILVDVKIFHNFRRYSWRGHDNASQRGFKNQYYPLLESYA